MEVVIGLLVLVVSWVLLITLSLNSWYFIMGSRLREHLAITVSFAILIRKLCLISLPKLCLFYILLKKNHFVKEIIFSHEMKYNPNITFLKSNFSKIKKLRYMSFTFSKKKLYSKQIENSVKCFYKKKTLNEKPSTIP
jgi:hypothetical protein